MIVAMLIESTNERCSPFRTFFFLGVSVVTAAASDLPHPVLNFLKS